MNVYKVRYEVRTRRIGDVKIHDPARESVAVLAVAPTAEDAVTSALAPMREDRSCVYTLATVVVVPPESEAAKRALRQWGAGDFG